MNLDFTHNTEYKKNLINTDIRFYKKYIQDILTLKGNQNKKFLDCGCGTGTVIRNLKDKKNNYGVDISDYFIKEIKEDGYNLLHYDGKHLPFPNDSFDIVGSFTVLEHVNDPVIFIQEQKRIVKSGGYMIIACPNFLSIFNKVRSYSLFYKLKSLIFYAFGSAKFIFMDPIMRKNGEFFSDDDAIVQTNLIHILKFLKQEGIKVIKVSGTMSNNNRFILFLSCLPFVRLFLPSCYIICQKN